MAYYGIVTIANNLSDLVKNCKGLLGLGACKCCCFENLLAVK